MGANWKMDATNWAKLPWWRCIYLVVIYSTFHNTSWAKTYDLSNFLFPVFSFQQMEHYLFWLMYYSWCIFWWAYHLVRWGNHFKHILIFINNHEHSKFTRKALIWTISLIWNIFVYKWNDCSYQNGHVIPLSKNCGSIINGL